MSNLVELFSQLSDVNFLKGFLPEEFSYRAVPGTLQICSPLRKGTDACVHYLANRKNAGLELDWQSVGNGRAMKQAWSGVTRMFD